MMYASGSSFLGGNSWLTDYLDYVSFPEKVIHKEDIQYSQGNIDNTVFFEAISFNVGQLT